VPKNQREVEQKVRITRAEGSLLREMVISLGFVPTGDPVTQIDIYGPTQSPDLTKRLRTETCGGNVTMLLTTKEPGPGAEGNSARIEVERKVAAAEYEQVLSEWRQEGALILVEKVRTPFSGGLDTEIGRLEISIGFDEVSRIGPDGGLAHFLELECIQPGDADEVQIAAVLQQLRLFIERLLGPGRKAETESYKKLAAKAAKAAAAST
jgi:hypothetical protein